MKKSKLIPIIGILVLTLIMVVPASAQLGDKGVSSFDVQNVSGNDNVMVTVTFYDKDGNDYTPTNLGTVDVPIANPFELDNGQSQQVYVPNIASGELPTGTYSVVISSTDKVVAVAGIGGDGAVTYRGSYSGFSSGASPFYIAQVSDDYFNWDSLISVMNLGSTATNITAKIDCENGTSGTLIANNVPPMSSHSFDLLAETPSGFPAGNQCIGSAEITSSTGQPLVAIDTERKSTGNTISYEGTSSGGTKIFIPSLSNAFSGWNSSLTVRKLGSGSTTVTVKYSDTGSSTCNLTDTLPSCQLYMPNADVHPSTGLFGATITSASLPVFAVSGNSKGTASAAYLGAVTGSSNVAIPSVSKHYYGWVGSITCQNVSSTPTKINIEYDGFAANAYDFPATNMAEGDTQQVFVPNENFLPNGWNGGVSLKTTAPGAEIFCIAGLNNLTKVVDNPGDWATMYNATGE